MTRHPASKWTALLAAALIGTLASPLARAHDDAYLDTVKTPHGGQMRMAGPLHLELVLDKQGSEVKERIVQVYLADHADKPVAASGATGTITLLMGKVKASAPLKVDGDNRLSATLKYAAVPGIKAIVAVTLPGQDPQQARFTPMNIAGKPAPASDGHASHKH